MKKFLFLSLCVATLMSCGQKQGPSEQEIQERIDAAVKAALEEKSATNQESADYSQNKTNNVQTNTSLGSEHKKNGVTAEQVYQEGYDKGVFFSHTNTLEWYLRHDCKELKSWYVSKCQYGFGKENTTNKEFFEQYKKGFIQGYKDGNAL